MCKVICPACGKVNEFANEEGFAEGPREYHAECWFASIKNFEVGQEYYQAMVLVNGTAIDCECGYFASLADSQADGEYQAASHDPVWQEKNPGCVSTVVRKYRVTEVNGDDFTSESIG